MNTDINMSMRPFRVLPSPNQSKAPALPGNHVDARDKDRDYGMVKLNSFKEVKEIKTEGQPVVVPTIAATIDIVKGVISTKSYLDESARLQESNPQKAVEKRIDAYKEADQVTDTGIKRLVAAFFGKDQTAIKAEAKKYEMKAALAKEYVERQRRANELASSSAVKK